MKNKEIGNIEDERNISLEVSDFIKSYSFPGGKLSKTNNNVYSEARLREVTRFISNKIQQYVTFNSNDNKILKLLESKIENDNVEAFIEKINHKDLLDAKTLKRFFKDGKTSSTTLNILKSFQKVSEYDLNKKSILKKIEGIYYIFNSHNTTKNSFQASILLIDSEGNNSLKFLTRNFETVTKRIKVEVVDNNKILFQIKDENSVTIFYSYIGMGQKDVPFLQAVYLYSNRSNKTIANLAVFAKIPTDNYQETFRNFKPLREKKTLKDLSFKLNKVESDIIDKYPHFSVIENIQQYLLNRARPIVPKTYSNSIPFDFSKDIACEPSINQTEAKHYQRALSYVGDYFIYFNERFPTGSLNDKYSKRNEFYSSVGKGILKIEKDKSTGILKCQMCTLKNNENTILKHTGFIVNHTLNNGHCIIIAMYLNPEKDRYVNLMLNVIDEKKFVGSFSISYSYPSALGTGAVVVVRQDSINKNNKIIKVPSSIYAAPTSSEEPTLEEKIINYISNNESSRTSPPLYDELKSYEPTIFQGLYKMYNFNNTKKSLKITLLRINANKEVIHLDQYNDLAFGKIELNRNTLNIVLKSNKNGRTGFCCIKVASGINPSYNENDDELQTFYSGTFCGISRTGRQTPVASKFLLEYLGKDKKIIEHEKEINFYKKIDIEDNTTLYHSWRFFNIKTIDKDENERNENFISCETNIYTKKDLIKLTSKSNS